MIQQIIDFGKSLPNELGVMFLSMLPLTELRAAIPIFIAKGMQPLLAYIMAVIGNMLPLPFVLALARPLFKWMKKRRCFTKIVATLDRKIEKNKDKVLKYEFWGLALFVAIPLPGTGAWTGAFIASILDLRYKNALPSIGIGVIIAGAIITLVSSGVLAGIKFIF